MSYILEALKKAQAERQLGAVPTIHAPAIAAAPASGAGLRNRPLVLALAALGLVTAGLLALVLRPVPPAASGEAPAPQRTNAALAPSALPGTPPASAPVAVAQTAIMGPPAAAVAPTPAPSAQPTPVQLPTDQPPTVQPTPVQPAAGPAHAAQSVAAPPSLVVSAAAPQSSAPVRAAAAVPAPSGEPLPRRHAATPEVDARTASGAMAPASAASAAPAQDEAIQNLRDLPEPIQRAIPPITMGGYMYSRNPADRLLLIDKVLRHEGEEVAPGLVLDKLQPRAAVFTFKGYRYRVPY
ncbi:MAG TPA: general secretion pathway protein GspB [Burkholderiaceae bacterium]|nr:general secretion pathway protein GspB [Burkholderiaceae bacterium]